MAKSKLIYNEKYHKNCHDYLKPLYIERYAVPKYKNMLYQIRNKIPKINICQDTPIQAYGETLVCDQHAMIFGHHSDIFPILATYALNACIGLLLYLPHFKVGCLCHIDGLPGYSKKSAREDGIKINFDPVTLNMNLILESIRKICLPFNLPPILDIDYYLIGGIYELSEVMIHDIIECINKYSLKHRFNFRGRNLLGPENQSRNICFDLRTGLMSHFDYLENSEFHAKYANKDGIPMNIIRAGRKSDAILDITYVPVLAFEPPTWA